MSITFTRLGLAAATNRNKNFWQNYQSWHGIGAWVHEDGAGPTVKLPQENPRKIQVAKVYTLK